MPIVRWRPITDFQTLRDEMDRRFNEFYRTFGEDTDAVCDCYPLVDVKETKDDFVVTAELPGVAKDDVKIHISDDVLTIKGEKKEEKKEKDHNYHRIERSYGKFQRSFTLPVPVQNDKVKAAYKDGILTITLPKKEEVKPKEISISVS
jgi:HSP20 family protein